VVKRGEDTRIVSLVAYLYAAEQKLTMLSWLEELDEQQL